MRRLFRSRQYRMIAGVCGGLGEYLQVDPTVVRLLWVLLSFFSCLMPGLLIYLVFWFLIPDEH